MRKQIALFIIGLFLMSVAVHADLEIQPISDEELKKEVKQVCDEVEKQTSKGKARELGCPRPSGGGSFILKKGKSLFGLKSEIDGRGFGTPLIVSPTRKVKLFMGGSTGGQIESLTVESAKFQRGSVHLKTGTPTSGVLGFELLSTLNQDATYTVVFRIPKNDHVFVEGATKLNRNNQKWDYYSINLKNPGLFVIS